MCVCVYVVKCFIERLQCAMHCTLYNQMKGLASSLLCRCGNWRAMRLICLAEVTQMAENRTEFLPRSADSSDHPYPLCSTPSLRTHAPLPQSPLGSGLCLSSTNSLDSRLSRPSRGKAAPAPDSRFAALWLASRSCPPVSELPQTATFLPA